MGKRSNFKRSKNDLYRTPLAPVLVLADHLPDKFTFAEPCAGDGRLIDHLRLIGGTCHEAIDINPGRGDIQQGNALRWSPRRRIMRPTGFIITNPPWTRDILHKLIAYWSMSCPTWLLFDADWMHTKQAAPYLGRCKKVVSVGRVKWIENSKHTGKDNCAWYLFDGQRDQVPEFHGRKM